MKKGALTLPIAIIIAAVIIAGAIIYATTRNSGSPSVDSEEPKIPGVENIKPVSDKDHILGNLNAPVKVIEFSDTECPFCKRFHDTMHQVISEYGAGDKVAWVYRHFPLDSLHTKARKEAEATECAAELGGNSKFWAYIDRLYEITPSNDRLDLAELPNIAEYVGLNRTQFEDCLRSGRHAARVQTDFEDAVNSGGRGTPFSIVINKSGLQLVVSGAQPFSAVKQVIEAALK